MSHTGYEWEYFVWIRFNGKVWPQKWGQDLEAMDKSVRMGDIAAKHKLTTEAQDLSIEELKKKYPAPEGSDGTR